MEAVERKLSGSTDQAPWLAPRLSCWLHPIPIEQEV